MPSVEIKWSEALSMKNAEIDAEHQQFIKLVNELNGVGMQQPLDKASIEKIMKKILADVTNHFTHEEQLLKEKGYPELPEHVQTHSELLNELKQALDEIQKTKIRAVWSKIGLSIKDKLVLHILDEDAKYIEYLRTE